MGVQSPRRGRWSVALGDLAQVDLVERGANDLRLVGLGVTALLQLAYQIFKPLDVFVVERDADDLVVRRLRLLVFRRCRCRPIELLEDHVLGERIAAEGLAVRRQCLVVALDLLQRSHADLANFSTVASLRTAALATNRSTSRR